MEEVYEVIELRCHIPLSEPYRIISGDQINAHMKKAHTKILYRRNPTVINADMKNTHMKNCSHG
jgi:hypothetical protein